MYDVYGEVIVYLGNRRYLVKIDDGGEVTATFNDDHELVKGTKVGLKSLSGSWKMEEI